jgi:amino acid transporter
VGPQRPSPMKKLTWQLIIPLTVISFVIFTKWWYVLIIDGTDIIFRGFPLPYICDGWATSMSLYVFIPQLLIDLLVYFTFWFILIYCIRRYILPIKINRFISIVLVSITVLIIALNAWVLSFEETKFYFKKDFQTEIITTGYRFIWQPQVHPDLLKYRTEKIK